MKIINYLLSPAAIFCVLVLSGCGVRFRNEMVNLGLPDDWKYRTPIKNTAGLRFFLQENVGLLVTPGSTPKTYEMLAQPILPDNFTARETIIKDGIVYSSKITQGASIQGGYLAFATDLNDSQVVDYHIVDISRVDIPWNQFPDAKIRAAAAVPNPNNVKRLWIQSLILSRVLSQNYTKIDSDAKGAGPAFQVAGKCFNTTGAEVIDYAIGVVFVDIDQFVQKNPGSGSSIAAIRSLKDPHSILEPTPNVDKGKTITPPIASLISVEPPISEIRNFLKK